MILTEAELSAYAPGVDVASRAGAILLAQLAAESAQGANRPLEKQQFSQILTLSSARLGVVQLPYAPVHPEDAVTVEVRLGNIRDRYHRSVPLSDWRTLSAEEYRLDETGQLNLHLGGGSNFALGYGHGLRPSGITATQARVTYFAGLDFSINSLEVQVLKAALGQIISYQQSAPYTMGATVVDLKQEYRVQFGSATGSNSAGAGQVPDAFLLPFRRYRPRGL